MSEYLLKLLAPIIVDSIKKVMSNLIDEQKPNDIEITDCIKNHLTKAINWSQKIDIYALSQAKNTQDDTVPLQIETIPRKFRVPDKISPVIEEQDILTTERHVVIMGDPGAGKTTTMKRIINRLITKEASNYHDFYQYPIFIRLRELNQGSMLLNELASILGISFKIEKIEAEVTNERLEVIDEMTLKNIAKTKLSPEEYKAKSKVELKEIGGKILIDSNKDYTMTPAMEVAQKIKSKETIIHRVAKVGNRLLEDVLADIFNDSNALVLLDGLDEVELSHKANIEKEIESLALKLSASKIIVTQRSGDYTKTLEGFDELNLRPLSPNQVRTIASKWFPNIENFLDELKAKPYEDLAMRPLFLANILLLYDKYGELPEKANEIYDKMIKLMLEDWDLERGIKRASKYTGFSAEKKLAFLSTLSFNLTYKKQTKVFTHKDLVDCYNNIFEGFDLPSGEAHQVANEIETHTGLIVGYFGNYFEFSHLSLQEYLCARYLVNSPILPVLQEYIKYPAPLAVAVSLSYDPGNWLAGIVLHPTIGASITEEIMTQFLTRLMQEGPQFVPSDILGITVLHLISGYAVMENEQLIKCLFWLYLKPTVKKSVDSVVRRYFRVNEFTEVYNYVQFDNVRKFFLVDYGSNLNIHDSLLIRKEFATKILDLI